jgi:hypothetical protein
MIAEEDLPVAWREFLDSLARRPGGRWIADTYRRHRGTSAELSSPTARARTDGGGGRGRLCS